MLTISTPEASQVPVPVIVTDILATSAEISCANQALPGPVPVLAVYSKAYQLVFAQLVLVAAV